MSATAETPVAPVLDQMVEFMEQAIKESNDHQATIGQLKASIAKLHTDQERVVLEKVASAKAAFFNKEALETALTRLEGMGLIDAPNREKIAKRIMEDPNMIIPFLTKVAETLVSAPGDGEGISKEADSGEVPDDPDGWKAMAKGQSVPVRR